MRGFLGFEGEKRDGVIVVDCVCVEDCMKDWESEKLRDLMLYAVLAEGSYVERDMVFGEREG